MLLEPHRQVILPDEVFGRIMSALDLGRAAIQKLNPAMVGDIDFVFQRIHQTAVVPKSETNIDTREVVVNYTKEATKEYDQKNIRYGDWYVCREGNMPEDILGFDEWNYQAYSPMVIVPVTAVVQTKSGHTHVQYMSVRRIRQAGKQKWHWAHDVTPCIWMPIPEHPKVLDWVDENTPIEEVLKYIQV